MDAEQKVGKLRKANFFKDSRALLSESMQKNSIGESVSAVHEMPTLHSF